jgi:hypothetical protein
MPLPLIQCSIMIWPSCGAALRVVTHSDLIRFFAMFAPAEEGEGGGAQEGEGGAAEQGRGDAGAFPGGLGMY